MTAMRPQSRMAMGVHHTPTMMGDWDGPAMVARIPDDAGEAVLRKMYAWMDPDGDPAAKSSYKLPHHMVSESGEVGAANMKACSAAIAALNGGRGGANIPDADRQKVWDHLAAHMEDGDMEPPELKSRLNPNGCEIRYVPIRELRVEPPDSTGKRVVKGHAAVYNAMSVPLFFFQERIEPGAFTETLASNPDVRALWNHESSIILGRTKSGTLRLAEDRQGLAIEIDMPMWAHGYAESIERGDVDQMSFAFRVPDGGDRWEGTIDNPIRVLTKIDLHDGDVSPVTYPAYPQTDVGVRTTEMRAALSPSLPEPPHAGGPGGDSSPDPHARELDALAREVEILGLEV